MSWSASDSCNEDIPLAVAKESSLMPDQVTERDQFSHWNTSG